MHDTTRSHGKTFLEASGFILERVFIGLEDIKRTSSWTFGGFFGGKFHMWLVRKMIERSYHHFH